MQHGDRSPIGSEGSLSIAAQILGMVTSLSLHPLLRRGNAARSTRRVLEALGWLIGQTAGGVAIQHADLGGVESTSSHLRSRTRPPPSSTCTAAPTCRDHPGRIAGWCRT